MNSLEPNLATTLNYGTVLRTLMSLNLSKFLWSLSLPLVISASGCHMVEVSERYGDVIDSVADRQLSLDNVYRPGLDLTRLGHRRIHQEAVVRNIGFYPNSAIPNSAIPSQMTAPQEPTVPPSDTENYSPLPQPPLVPPVPAAEKLPVLDTNSLKEMSKWTPTAPAEAPAIFATSSEPTSPEKTSVVQSSSLTTTVSTSDDFSVNVIPSLDALDANPQEVSLPVSAPSTVPPSQKFYSARESR